MNKTLVLRRDRAEGRYRGLLAAYRSGLLLPGQRRPTEAQVEKARVAFLKAEARIWARPGAFRARPNDE